MTDFYHDRTLRSRKEHMCSHCRQTISVGGSARYSVGVVNGEFVTAYAHITCHNAAQELDDISSQMVYEFLWLHEVDEIEDLRWLMRHHPEAADRINAAPRVARHDLEQL